MYMISKEWQILWVLDESAFCNDQLWHKCQSYFYISLILSTHRHFLLACTSCWNVAHYQSHCFDLLFQQLLADFLLFSSCQKLLSKIEEQTGDKYASSLVNIFIGTQDFLETVFTITHLSQHSRQRRKMRMRWSTDRSGRFSCRSAPCRRCLRGNP